MLFRLLYQDQRLLYLLLLGVVLPAVLYRFRAGVRTRVKALGPGVMLLRGSVICKFPMSRLDGKGGMFVKGEGGGRKWVEISRDERLMFSCDVDGYYH